MTKANVEFPFMELGHVSHNGVVYAISLDDEMPEC
jgi:hypothetical protein